MARRAGVSPAVVTYVTSPGSRPVSVAARARVEEAIEFLGYRPNSVAQSLRRSSTMTLGLIVPNLQHPSLSDLGLALENLAYELGYVLFVFTTANSVERHELYLRSLIERQVDALIVVGSHSSELYAQAVTAGTPVVVLDRTPSGIGIDSVAPDVRTPTAAGVRHLIEAHGHQKIACVAGPLRFSAIHDQVSGWRDAMQSANLPLDNSLLSLPEELTEDSGYRATMQLLDQGHPTAILVISEMQARGVTAALTERGLSVPGDVALVSYAASHLIGPRFTGVTSIDVPIADLATRAIGIVMNRLEHPGGEETHEMLPSR
ncbi:MAG: LacI family DNA-binding transcriptional regulator, partial [Microbacteriaceae bacterium]|nr:LacI family DNA-binding transcriptional regulator [Microbacteriaceae bacterium]